MEPLLVLNDVEYCPRNKIIMYYNYEDEQCLTMDLKDTKVSTKYNYARSKDRKPKHIIGNLYLVNGKYVIEAYHESRTVHGYCSIARTRLG
jgi:hypothetical protein